jgi:hypothetical protein
VPTLETMSEPERHEVLVTALDRLVPTPRLVEIDRIDLEAPPARVWERVRHGDLAHSPLVRALFAIRTLGKAGEPLRVDALTSSPEAPGFQLLVDEPPRELAVGAIGKVWERHIPFVHVATAAEFAAFAQPDFARVAWSIRLSPRGSGTHLELELRVDTTDEGSWQKFRRYFRLIGIGSRFIRRLLLAGLARELGRPRGREEDRPLPGDELLADAAGQFTHWVDIAAPPEVIWPWLVQMGCGRAGYYSYDLLDNGGTRSAREIHPELQALSVGDVLPAGPGSDDGFEVLSIESPRLLVLGGLFDADAGDQLPFHGKRPGHYWHVTWAFLLAPLDARSTRLTVRARAACRSGQRILGPRLVHAFMEAEQLRQLAARAEGRLGRDDWRDVMAGVGGAAMMTIALLTPFLRGRRSHWGVKAEAAERPHPADELVPAPRWAWTHGVEIDAPAAEVWPWVAQIGADRGGFYSYQWLENVAGCQVRNAETIHPEWEVRVGDQLVLHPEQPALPVVACERGHWFVVHAAMDETARSAGKPWVTASWLFQVEPLGEARCSVISRYRADCSDDLVSRLRFGPTLVEPVGFAMDRRMLLGVKQRAERVAAVATR